MISQARDDYVLVGERVAARLRFSSWYSLIRSCNRWCAFSMAASMTPCLVMTLTSSAIMGIKLCRRRLFSFCEPCLSLMLRSWHTHLVPLSFILFSAELALKFAFSGFECLLPLPRLPRDGPLNLLQLGLRPQDLVRHKGHQVEADPRVVFHPRLDDRPHHSQPVVVSTLTLAYLRNEFRKAHTMRDRAGLQAIQLVEGAVDGHICDKVVRLTLLLVLLVLLRHERVATMEAVVDLLDQIHIVQADALDIGGQVRGELAEVAEGGTKVELAPIEEDGEDGLRRARVMDHLVRKEDVRVMFRGLGARVLLLGMALVPLEQEDEAIDGPVALGEQVSCGRGQVPEVA